MTRIVVVLERRWWPPRRSRTDSARIVSALSSRYRLMPDTAERLSDNFVEIPFPPRTDLNDARRQVVAALDSIDPRWRRHLSMINERTIKVRGGVKQ